MLIREKFVLFITCLVPFLVGKSLAQGDITTDSQINATSSIDFTTSAPIIAVETHLIPEGGSGKLQCATANNTLPESNLEFAWSYHGLPHIDHGYFDQTSGSLYINDANVMSSGRYDCWWAGAKTKSEDSSGSYFHRLIIYKLPEIQFKVTMPHMVAHCVDSVDSQAIKRYRAKLCPAEEKGGCPYEVSYKCSAAEDEQQKPTLVVTVDISLPTDYKAPADCNTKCIRKHMAIELNSLKDALEPKWNEVFEHDHKASQWYNNATGKPTEEILESCEAGFLPFNSSICAPCEPGTSWNATSSSCVPCPVNTYQDTAAALECKQCPRGKKTKEEGVTSITRCYGNSVNATSKLAREDRRKDKNSNALDMIIASGIGMAIISLFIVVSLLVLIVFIKKNERRQEKIIMHRHLEDADKFERLFGGKKLSSEKIVSGDVAYPSTSKDPGYRS